MKAELIKYDIDLIMNHPHQPRKTYSKEAIERLADSIQKNGLIQPIVLSTAHVPYRLVVGQRRLLAYKHLRDTVDKKKYKKIPAIIQSQDDLKKDTLVALTENIHREDLNIIDKAESFKTLIDCGFASTHKEIANLLSISQQMATKYISIADLEEAVKKIVIDNKYVDTEVLSRLSKSKKQTEIIEKIIKEKYPRKSALRLISENTIKIVKPERKLKSKNNAIVQGVWGKLEKTPKRVNLRIDPLKLDGEKKKLFEKLVSLLEQDTKE